MNESLTPPDALSGEAAAETPVPGDLAEMNEAAGVPSPDLSDVQPIPITTEPQSAPGTFEKAGLAVQSAKQAAGEAVGSAVTGAREALGDAVSSARETVTGAVASAKERFSNVDMSAPNVGRKIDEGISWLRSKAQEGASAVATAGREHIVNPVVDKANEALYRIESGIEMVGDAFGSDMDALIHHGAAAIDAHNAAREAHDYQRAYDHMRRVNESDARKIRRNTNREAGPFKGIRALFRDLQARNSEWRAGRAERGAEGVREGLTSGDQAAAVRELDALKRGAGANFIEMKPAYTQGSAAEDPGTWAKASAEALPEPTRARGQELADGIVMAAENVTRLEERAKELRASAAAKRRLAHQIRTRADELYAAAGGVRLERNAALYTRRTAEYRERRQGLIEERRAQVAAARNVITSRFSAITGGIRRRLGRRGRGIAATGTGTPAEAGAVGTPQIETL